MLKIYHFKTHCKSNSQSSKMFASKRFQVSAIFMVKQEQCTGSMWRSRIQAVSMDACPRM